MKNWGGALGICVSICVFFIPQNSLNAAARKQILFNCRNAVSAITPEFIARMRAADAALSPLQKQLRRIARVEGFEAAARQDIPDDDNLWTVEVKMGKPTNQKRSGRCWLFDITNWLRTLAIQRGVLKESDELSQARPHFFSYLEKGNTTLARAFDYFIENFKKARLKGGYDEKALKQHISHTIDHGEGGFWEWGALLIKRYKVVPHSVTPDSATAMNTASLETDFDAAVSKQLYLMVQAANQIVTEDAFASDQELLEHLFHSVEKISKRAQEIFWTILTTRMGDPVEEFDYSVPSRGPDGKMTTVMKRITPAEFTDKILRFHPENYVTITHNPLRPYYQAYHLENSAIAVPREGEKPADRIVLNLPIEKIKELIYASLSDETFPEPVMFNSDVKKDSDIDANVMYRNLYRRDLIYGFPEGTLEMPLKDRIKLGTANETHAMLITGAYKRNGKLIRLRVENSWGDEHQVWKLYADWADDNVFAITIHKRFLTRELRRLFREENLVHLPVDKWEIGDN